MGRLKGPVRAVLFDLGGTLIYENGPWDTFFPRADQELWKVLHDAGVTLQPGDVYGDSRDLFEYYYARHRGDLNEPTTAGVLDELLRSRGVTIDKAALRAAVKALFTVTQTNWLPEEDAVPTLRDLKERGLKIGLVSNASDDDNTQALVDKGGFRPYLDYIVSSAAFGRRKPAPEIFRSMLDHLRASSSEAVMIGDDYEADIVGAKALGMQAIWITRRIAAATRSGVEANIADSVVAALSEIPPLLSPG